MHRSRTRGQSAPWLIALAGAFVARERCGPPPPAPTSAPWAERLERALRCDGASAPAERTRCFQQAITALNLWPAGAERDRGFARARSELASWPAAHRAASASMVLYETEGHVLDTMQLVGALEDWYPEDTDRPSAERTRLTIASPFAERVESFSLVRAPVSYRWFAEGPGLSRLRALSLRDTGDPRRDFSTLARWRGIETLEHVALHYERELVSGDALWAVLRAAPALRSLAVYGLGAGDAAGRLRSEPAVSARLRALSLREGYLGERDVRALVENKALASLETLDLRGNPLRDEDAARLRGAPHFAKTEILLSLAGAGAR